MDDEVKILCSDRAEMLLGSGLKASAEDWDPPTAFFSIFTSRYYSQQQTVWRRWWDRVRLFWFVVRGREFSLEEVVVFEAAPLREMEAFCGRWAKEIEDWEKKTKAKATADSSRKKKE